MSPWWALALSPTPSAPRFNDAVADDITLKGREKAFKDFAEQILEYTCTLSDDGQYAIVEFVACNRAVPRC